MSKTRDAAVRRKALFAVFLALSLSRTVFAGEDVLTPIAAPEAQALNVPTLQGSGDTSLAVAAPQPMTVPQLLPEAQLYVPAVEEDRQGASASAVLESQSLEADVPQAQTPSLESQSSVEAASQGDAGRAAIEQTPTPESVTVPQAVLESPAQAASWAERAFAQLRLPWKKRSAASSSGATASVAEPSAPSAASIGGGVHDLSGEQFQAAHAEALKAARAAAPAASRFELTKVEYHPKPDGAEHHFFFRAPVADRPQLLLAEVKETPRGLISEAARFGGGAAAATVFSPQTLKVFPAEAIQRAKSAFRRAQPGRVVLEAAAGAAPVYKAIAGNKQWVLDAAGNFPARIEAAPGAKDFRLPAAGLAALALAFVLMPFTTLASAALTLAGLLAVAFGWPHADPAKSLAIPELEEIEFQRGMDEVAGLILQSRYMEALTRLEGYTNPWGLRTSRKTKEQEAFETASAYGRVAQFRKGLARGKETGLLEEYRAEAAAGRFHGHEAELSGLAGQEGPTCSINAFYNAIKAAGWLPGAATGVQDVIEAARQLFADDKIGPETGLTEKQLHLLGKSYGFSMQTRPLPERPEALMSLLADKRSAVLSGVTLAYWLPAKDPATQTERYELQGDLRHEVFLAGWFQSASLGQPLFVAIETTFGRPQTVFYTYEDLRGLAHGLDVISR